MKRLLRSMHRDTRGATAIEYGLILAMIFFAIVVAVSGFASENSAIWNTVKTKSNNAIDAS